MVLYCSYKASALLMTFPLCDFNFVPYNKCVLTYKYLITSAKINFSEIKKKIVNSNNDKSGTTRNVVTVRRQLICDFMSRPIFCKFGVDVILL